jgi:hypothetical protein
MQENMEMFVEVVGLFNGHVGNNINPKSKSYMITPYT